MQESNEAALHFNGTKIGEMDCVIRVSSYKKYIASLRVQTSEKFNFVAYMKHKKRLKIKITILKRLNKLK